MSTRLFSIRMQESTLARLVDQARLRGESKSALAQRLIDEGLRMAAFPGIVFRDGPTGRRAALAHGLDVWELIPLLELGEPSEAEVIQRETRALGLRPDEVSAAIRYYEAFRDEVDERIRANAELARRFEADWRRAQGVLAG